LIPELLLNWMPPPPALGSGMSGTPCVRMQSANLIPMLTWPVPDGLLDEPHALSAIAQPTAATQKGAVFTATVVAAGR
jgi:hypothetical protein